MADYQPPALKVQQQDLKGKVAIVTGASKGIGRAIALDLSTRGCSILGTYSSPQSAHIFDVLAHTIQDVYHASGTPDAAPKLAGVVADITSLASIGAVLQCIERDFANKIDILVLNASFNTRPKIGQASESDIEKSLVGNLQWPIVLLENLVRHNVFNQNSRVVTISSDRVRDPSPGSSLFNATKAGLEALSRSWAIELPVTFPGTTVNAVSVGLTDTPGLRGFSAAAVEALKAQRVPKVKVVEGGRMGYAEDVADVVGWLVSEKARWVTGSVVAANGGAEWVGGSS
ncbi:NAD(P)-binding protein [Ophiobolus disseminans]|uniref:NAD(P)-binding protein n=1 Tax=Ophiobolus disseminans TaxID=1469910 RepID=A0A6A7A9L0_9PLEO|nr:NAD(P)-binding protein [Ophiobolus disseminans]